jgi:signal transduction histidine kinase
MRLLQVSLRSLLIYSFILIAVSIPITFFAIRHILNKEVDKSLALQSNQFIRHIKSFEYLGDLEMDLEVWDQLSYDITIKPSPTRGEQRHYESVSLYDSLEQDYHPFRVLATPVMIRNNPYMLTIRMSLVDNDDLVLGLFTVQMVMLVLLATGLLLLNRSLSRKLWVPFYHTLSQLKAYEVDGNGSIEPEKTNIIEFNDLNKTVSHLTQRSRKVFLQQKEFIENASHELQTPLAIFHSKLDMLMQNTMLNEQDANIIQELEDTAQRMSRLNKNLLLLSKIENEQFTEKEEINVSAIITTLLNNLKPFADVEEITLTSSLQELHIQANRTLLEVLFNNLFHNAIRHTPRAGQVNVCLQGQTLTVSNTGEALTIHPEKVFERFFKASNHEKSTGLGLAIVKKICDVCNYQITYRFEKENHIFTVTL